MKCTNFWSCLNESIQFNYIYQYQFPVIQPIMLSDSSGSIPCFNFIFCLVNNRRHQLKHMKSLITLTTFSHQVYDIGLTFRVYMKWSMESTNQFKPSTKMLLGTTSTKSYFFFVYMFTPVRGNSKELEEATTVCGRTRFHEGIVRVPQEKLVCQQHCLHQQLNIATPWSC